MIWVQREGEGDGAEVAEEVEAVVTMADKIVDTTHLRARREEDRTPMEHQMKQEE